VREVGELLEDKHWMEIYRKTASGFSHGRQWVMFNVLVREEVIPIGNATDSVRVTSTPSRVLWGAGAAYEMINRVLPMYYLACGHDPDTMQTGIGSERRCAPDGTQSLKNRSIFSETLIYPNHPNMV
jgi:hypothetical protein